MKLKHRAILLLSLLFMTFGTVYFSQLTLADGTIKPIPIGLYWDEECTNPVSSIDFGKLVRGQSKSITLWLKSHSNGKGRISWGSSNFNPSSDGITECWKRTVGRFRYISNWHRKMKPEDLWKVRYTIHLAQDIQAGGYSWDLIICRTSHKSSPVNCLAVSCAFYVT